LLLKGGLSGALDRLAAAVAALVVLFAVAGVAVFHDLCAVAMGAGVHSDVGLATFTTNSLDSVAIFASKPSLF
jgi:hypothetical protein